MTKDFPIFQYSTSFKINLFKFFKLKLSIECIKQSKYQQNLKRKTFLFRYKNNCILSFFSYQLRAKRKQKLYSKKKNTTFLIVNRIETIHFKSNMSYFVNAMIWNFVQEHNTHYQVSLLYHPNEYDYYIVIQLLCSIHLMKEYTLCLDRFFQM